MQHTQQLFLQALKAALKNEQVIVAQLSRQKSKIFIMN